MPASTAWPPNQTMATEMMFMSIIMHGHHEGHRAIREYISTGELAIGLVVTLALAIAASKSPDRHDTGDDFARDEVVAVHEFSHPGGTRGMVRAMRTTDDHR
ncbi:MAG: hypothetical protein ACLTSX_00480 [Collinsella sp.]